MPEKIRHRQAAWDEAAEERAPAPRGAGLTSPDEVDRMRAQGIPEKSVVPIDIVFDRHDLHQLLLFLEERAIEADNYFLVRQAVLFGEMIRGQARKQGY